MKKLSALAYQVPILIALVGALATFQSQRSKLPENMPYKTHHTPSKIGVGEILEDMEYNMTVATVSR